MHDAHHLTAADSRIVEIVTPRLHLRRWVPSDREPFAAMNADPKVMEFFPKLMTSEESDALYDRIHLHFAERGFGLWAVEIPDVAPFAGYIGLGIPRFEAPFMPCVEIGWRLVKEVWNRGYATEGAAAVLKFAFETLGFMEVVSFTAVINTRSQRIMEKIGMLHSPQEDFFHPLLPRESPLAYHVLYRAVRNSWTA